MARSGAGVYSLPVGTSATDGDVLEASRWNTVFNDLASDLNTPRPVVAGGTGADTAADARTNLGLEIGADVPAYFSSAYVRAHTIASGTVIPASTPTKITYSTEESDAGSHYASGTYTAPATGVYDIRAGAQLPAGTGSWQTFLSIYVEGAAKVQGVQMAVTGTRSVIVSNTLPLTSGDEVEIYITHDNASSITVNSPNNGADRWYFEARRVG